MSIIEKAANRMDQKRAPGTTPAVPVDAGSVAASATSVPAATPEAAPIPAPVRAAAMAAAPAAPAASDDGQAGINLGRTRSYQLYTMAR